MKKETKEAIEYLHRMLKLNKNTAYDLVLGEVETEYLKIALEYIKELERENKDADIVIVRQNKEIKELQEQAMEKLKKQIKEIYFS